MNLFITLINGTHYLLRNSVILGNQIAGTNGEGKIVVIHQDNIQTITQLHA